MSKEKVFEDWMYRVQKESETWEYICSSKQAEFWIRAFCEEVERKAQEFASVRGTDLNDQEDWEPEIARGAAYHNLKKELLGEK